MVKPMQDPPTPPISPRLPRDLRSVAEPIAMAHVYAAAYAATYPALDVGGAMTSARLAVRDFCAVIREPADG